MGKPKIAILCCNYTNSATYEDFKDFPCEIVIKRFPCSGSIEIVDILKEFEDDAEGVLVCGCEKEKCHNKTGNLRAEKKVLGAKKYLEEIGINPERAQMAFVPRLDTGVFVEIVKDFVEEILNKDEDKK